MSNILPKGIVVNSPGISGDIQRIDRDPLAVEEIAKLWKVYTTTRRRLLDPTAERLENYWWRLWGSRKRHLSGASVARLFAIISDGNSFVPLRGPLNRDESGSQRAPLLTRGPGTASITAMRFGTESPSSSSPPLSSGSKNPSARPPPILKKARGPSSTGPRPTARFISPHDSEGDEATQTSPNPDVGAQVMLQPPTPESHVSGEDKTTDASTAPRRRVHQFPASNATHKRRPGVVRRPNSDPTNKSHEAARGALLGKEPSRTAPDVTGHRKELGKLQNDSQSQESSSSSPSGRPEDKGSKKMRPNKKGQPKMPVGQSSRSRSHPGEVAEQGSTVRAVGLDGPRKGSPHCTAKQELLTKENEAPQKTTADPAASYSNTNVKGKAKSLTGAEISLAPKQHQHARAGPNTHKNLDLKGPVSLAPTYTIASGNPNILGPSTSTSADDNRLKVNEGVGEGSSVEASLFARRSVHPTRSTSSLFVGSVPPQGESMSRSKSHLTLLLERDRVKSSDQGKKPTSSKAKKPDVR